jgi:hypothetical protein
VLIAALISKKPEKERGFPASEYLSGQLCPFPSAAIPTSDTRPARRYPVKQSTSTVPCEIYLNERSWHIGACEVL